MTSDDNDGVTPKQTGHTRRDLLKAAPATGFLLGSGAFAGTMAATTGQARASNGPTPLEGPGIETTSAQALYTLPRDHAWHGGEFYQTNDLNEWHYITIHGRDLDTGERVSVFWSPLIQGWIAEEGRPMLVALFSFHNLDTGEFRTSLVFPKTGPLTTEGSGPDAENFHFRYAIDDGDNGFETQYRHDTDTWTMSSYNTKDNEWNDPFRLSFTAKPEAPGYVPFAYWGLESIGVDPQNRQNPETMYGLTYYYAAPAMASSGEIEVAGRTVRFEGTGWFEHQWGNLRNTYQWRYFWAWFRFENGDLMSFRQYYKGLEFRDPHYTVNRYLFMDGETFERSYAFGPAFKLIPERMWTSPKSGKRYPWWGRIETPNGTFWYEPSHPEQEGKALAGPYIEGVIHLRERPDGPIVATGFCEMIMLTDPLPDGNDPSDGPAFSRGLPENEDGPWKPTL